MFSPLPELSLFQATSEPLEEFNILPKDLDKRGSSLGEEHLKKGPYSQGFTALDALDRVPTFCA